MELTFGAAILVGLLGSSHCLGMCGGIVSAFSMGLPDPVGQSPRSLFVYQLAYNSGRIGSYVLVGLLAGTLGAGLVGLGVSPMFGRLVAAVFMIALGLYLANWWRGLAVLERYGAIIWRHLQPLGQRLLPIRNPLQAFAMGAVWGWLPCGLVYSVVAWSLSTGNSLDAALLMLGFGLGTLPSMLLAGNAFNYFRQWAKMPAVRTTAGLLIIAFGLYSAAGIFAHAHHHHTETSSTAAGLAVLQAEGRVPAILRNIS